MMENSRVEANTAPEVNQRIRRKMLGDIARCSQSEEAIDARLEELDNEWDIERVLEMNSAGLTLLGLTLGASSGKRWFLLPLLVQSFLMNHAVKGWCPPLPILRRLGYRTQTEIDSERMALKVLRGDLVEVHADLDQSASYESNHPKIISLFKAITNNHHKHAGC
ncbi:MAG: hypothetical protein KDD42_07315 [Bdellovibrionales bacterium]|nr:hypothetical protein [Bdellovibrionales bacterium]